MYISFETGPPCAFTIKGPMVEDVELSRCQCKRDKDSSGGRPYITLKDQKKTAIGYACEDIFGSSTPGSLRNMRMSLS